MLRNLKFRSLVCIGVAMLSAFSARGELASASCHSLMLGHSTLILHGEFEKIAKEGRWQEAAWRALESDHVELATQIEIQIEKSLLTSKIVSKEMSLSGSSDAFLVRFEDGLQAVFKPNFAKGWKKRVRPFHDLRMPIKEVAAYRLDRLLKANLIPVTVLRTIDGQLGSLQLFMHVDRSPSPHLTKRNSTRLTILDFVAQTYDRTPPNVLTVDGGPVAIDNAMSFLLQPPHVAFGIQWPPRLERIAKLQGFSAELNSLHRPTSMEWHQTLGGLLTEEEIQQSVDKLAELIRLQASLEQNADEGAR